MGDDGELQWEVVDEDSCSSWKVAEFEESKIKRHPEGKVIFAAYLFGCMFEEGDVISSIESMVGGSSILDIPFLEIFILRQPASERNRLCQHLFILMSLTQDEELLFALGKCTPLYDLGWRPNVKDLLTVFFNWGAPVSLLCDRTCNIAWQPDPIIKDGKPIITADNIKLVLHHMESALPHVLQEGEPTVDILIRTCFLMSMEKIFVITFTRRYLLHCLSVIVDQIPDNMWNKEKVWHLSELAFTGVEGHIHDISVLCKKLFTLCDRCDKIGSHLSYRIVRQCFQTVEHRSEMVLPELPITASHIIKLISSNTRCIKEMNLFYVDVIVDVMCTVIMKNSVSEDDEQNVEDYLDCVLNAVRENYKSHDVTAVRQKLQRLKNLLKPRKIVF